MMLPSFVRENVLHERLLFRLVEDCGRVVVLLWYRHWFADVVRGGCDGTCAVLVRASWKRVSTQCW